MDAGVEGTATAIKSGHPLPSPVHISKDFIIITSTIIRLNAALIYVPEKFNVFLFY